MTAQIFTASGTFTVPSVPAGSTLLVECIGAGSGGSGATQLQGGSGGAGGCYASKVLVIGTDVAVGASLTVTVAPAGAGGAAATPSVAATASSVKNGSTTLVSANGGGAATTGTTATSSTTGCVGTTILAGGSGFAATGASAGGAGGGGAGAGGAGGAATNVGATAGAGGPAGASNMPGGAGGAGGASSGLGTGTAGVAATAPGGGGGAGGQGLQNGGAGAAGGRGQVDISVVVVRTGSSAAKTLPPTGAKLTAVGKLATARAADASQASKVATAQKSVLASTAEAVLSAKAIRAIRAVTASMESAAATGIRLTSVAKAAQVQAGENQWVAPLRYVIVKKAAGVGGADAATGSKIEAIIKIGTGNQAGAPVGTPRFVIVKKGSTDLASDSAQGLKAARVAKASNTATGQVAIVHYALQTFSIAGYTRSYSNNQIVGACRVTLFQTGGGDDSQSVEVASMMSDPVTGYYAFSVSSSFVGWATAIQPGSPDIFGRTDDGLTPTINTIQSG